MSTRTPKENKETKEQKAAVNLAAMRFVEPARCQCKCGKSADGTTRVACGKLAIKGKVYCISCKDHYGMEF